MLKYVKSLLIAAIMCATGPAQAEDRVTLGWGRMFTNDALGDQKDRWRTGGYQVSRVRGYSWDGVLPTTPGEILEFRASAQIVAPEDLISPPPLDRRYAAMLSFGLHTQFDWRGNDVSIGSDLVFLGPQTGISNFQKWIHNMVGLEEPTVIDQQIGNGIYPTLEAELGRKFALGDRAELRPFVQAQAGVESFVRVGGDLVIGTLGRDDLMVRDSVTGQRYRAVEGTHDQGVSLIIGGDMAKVFDSALLPSNGVATLSEERSRLRAGVHWQGERASLFYGVSYLSKEFEQQTEGQLVGGLNLNLKF
ncbi:hypothetical protein GCM10010873_13940 [Cypionkella aquatica]|uniref:DUF2219 domain-containing protein n=1 Tax=Cypionkella aquatica TaxID=1756042 RepID=A0AA37X134_9RHOB|nr:lipid A-modifier LpxR family protein [Cypionkella aquatica]GLS86420.1 hypothetical protein GCM10010873_13940 [Cypionkella aquatica]